MTHTDAQKAADPVAAITERLDAIAYLTDDEWVVHEDDDSDPECTEHDIRAGQRPAGGGAVVFTRICHTEQGEAAARFLAEAPRDIRWLLDNAQPDTTSMRLHAEACQRFCDLGETVLKLAAEGKWGELVEHTADALNNADAVEEGDEELYERAAAQARYANSRHETYEVAKQLVARPSEWPNQLLVDCAAVQEDENDIGMWLIEFRDDQWHHWQSDGHGSLFETLYAISACYTPTTQARGREIREQLRAERAARPESGDSGGA